MNEFMVFRPPCSLSLRKDNKFFLFPHLIRVFFDYFSIDIFIKAPQKTLFCGKDNENLQMSQVLLIFAT